MARRGRGMSRAAASAAAVARWAKHRVAGRSTPARPTSDNDEDMLDETEDPQQQSNDEQEQGDEEQEADEEPNTAGESDRLDGDSNTGTPQDSQSVSRRGRKQGRAPRAARPPDWDTPEPAGDEAGSEAGTPRRRGRGRGGWRGGFRGRPRYGPKVVTQATRQAIDKEGATAQIIDDEAVLEEDAQGETKVDKMGNLLGGRDYRVRVFTIAGRGKRLYMLSTEPARCTGFRDSYLFFNKHLNLVKIIVDDYEKRDLIDRDVIPHSYKGRSIGIATARSVFREFGARIVIGGKKVIDDYYAQAARDRGDVEGELADPFDKIPGPTEDYNKNQYVAWHGASSVYHNNQPTVPLPNGKPVFGKRKATITSANWMYEHARAASLFNSRLAAERKKTHEGVYDAHTNVAFYPKIMQPTHARWEAVFPITSTPSPVRKLDMVNGTSTDPGTQDPLTAVNGDRQDSPSSYLPAPPTELVPSTERGSILPPLSTLITRNYLVVDTQLQTPPHAALPPPGPSPDLFNATLLPELDNEMFLDLPEDCRAALAEAKKTETDWRSMWGTEVKDGGRGDLRIGVGILQI